jgi:hypothetical protein
VPAAATFLQHLQDLLAIHLHLSLTEPMYTTDFLEGARLQATKFIERGIMHHNERRYALLLRGDTPPLTKILSEFETSFRNRIPC